MTSTTTIETSSRRPHHLDAAGFAIGFGLGGFFDGILLHQILQWHHLLSGLAAAQGDIGFLILTDGLFHLLMYLVTAVGLWLLWRARRAVPLPGADVRLLAAAMIGFGAWHGLDALLSHWLLGLHRIRMDTDAPLLWDLLWLAVFGIVPAVVGWRLLKRGTGGPRGRTSTPLILVLVAVGAGAVAALPPADRSTVMVLFRPGVTPAAALRAMGAAGGRLVWADSSAGLYAMDLSDGGSAAGLYLEGALLVGGSVIPAGCLDWTKA